MQVWDGWRGLLQDWVDLPEVRQFGDRLGKRSFLGWECLQVGDLGFQGVDRLIFVVFRRGDRGLLGYFALAIDLEIVSCVYCSKLVMGDR